MKRDEHEPGACPGLREIRSPITAQMSLAPASLPELARQRPRGRHETEDRWGEAGGILKRLNRRALYSCHRVIFCTEQTIYDFLTAPIPKVRAFQTADKNSCRRPSSHHVGIFLLPENGRCSHASVMCTYPGSNLSGSNATFPEIECDNEVPSPETLRTMMPCGDWFAYDENQQVGADSGNNSHFKIRRRFHCLRGISEGEIAFKQRAQRPGFASLLNGK
ncbi:hypothetical protein NDU88_001142 [Pleurodeles waltl]|uniref:Uncharacterized protein n=1 Tax=Pleurodeles waltl TaxID=8319 RepID=A0AAV7U7M8_PLEWA|nr:hypothetical protein NDU88_001142 [Pleurodeles waltl]